MSVFLSDGVRSSTARFQLKNKLFFSYIKAAGDNTCYGCTKPIETVGELSIEHIEPHMGRAEVFWDLENIAYSHLDCNKRRGYRRPLPDRPVPKPNLIHGRRSTYVNRGCRCYLCAESNSKYSKAKYWLDKCSEV